MSILEKIYQRGLIKMRGKVKKERITEKERVEYQEKDIIISVISSSWNFHQGDSYLGTFI